MQNPIFVNENKSANQLEILFNELKSNSSLRYVDMGFITIDSCVVKAVISIMANNKMLRIYKLVLASNDFQHLKNYLIKIKGIKVLIVTGCIFSRQDVHELTTAVVNNSQIQELSLLNCEMHIDQLLVILSYIIKLKWLHISNCQLDSKEIMQIFNVLKQQKYLQHVDLSANFMMNDAATEAAAMIKNNKHIQLLSLPSCVLDQDGFRIIIQAMQTVSSLQYIYFNCNTVDNELTSDIATVFANNSNLKELTFGKLTLKQSGFQQMKRHFVKLKKLRYLRIIDCIFSNPNVVSLETIIVSNQKIQELIISNCKLISHKVTTFADSIGIYDHLTKLELSNNSAINPFIHNLLVFLSCTSKLKQIIVCDCQLLPCEIKQILMVLKYMRHLETVDLSGNDMTDDSVSDMKAMIGNNEQLQKLCLPNCVLDQNSLVVIIQAMQTLLLLQHVDLNRNRIEDGLASDVAILIANNSHLKQLKFARLKLKQSGFDYLKTHLIKIEGLKYLKIVGCTFTYQDVVNFGTVIDNTSRIHGLDLSYSKALCEAEILYISLKLKNLSSLKRLYLNDIIITDQGEFEIINVICNNINLEYLEMAGCNLSTKFTSAIKCRNLVHLNLSNNNNIGKEIQQLLSFVSFNIKLKTLLLSNCQLKSRESKEVFETLKTLKHLRCVDLSANLMTDDAANGIAAMMINNKDIQKLILPDCVFTQNSLRTVIQSMQTVSSLLYIDFNANTIDNNLASDLAMVIGYNTRVEQIKFAKLELNQSGFNCLKAHLKIIYGIKYFKVTGCTFTDQDVTDLATAIDNNLNVQEVDLSYSKASKVQMLYIFLKIMNLSSLKSLNLNDITFTDQIT